MSSLDHLIKKLAGASPSVTGTSEIIPTEEGVEKTNPVYVEKLASAVDFIVDSINIEEPATEKVAAPREPVAVEDTSVSEISTRLRASLAEKLKNKHTETPEVSNEASDEDEELITNVLNRLKNMKASTQEEVKTGTETVEDEINQIYNIDDKNEPQIEADGEAAEKAASANLSLADVLNAALGTDEQTTDSDPVVGDEVAKTANVQGSSGLNARKDATKILKEKLMAKIGGEEA